MKWIHIIVEGSTEETFVNEVMGKHFAPLDKFVAARKIQTGWDRRNNKPAKGGLLKYDWLRNDILRWIESDRKKPNIWYTTFVDLYAFPTDDASPYTTQIQNIANPYQKITALETAIAQTIPHPNFIPYVQLHEFETFLLVDPDSLISLYPDAKTGINRLKKDIGNTNPEEINESQQTAPSKRIIQYLPAYKGQKAQVGPLVAEEIGMQKLRDNCRHFDEWIRKLENI